MTKMRSISLRVSDAFLPCMDDILWRIIKLLYFVCDVGNLALTEQIYFKRRLTS